MKLDWLLYAGALTAMVLAARGWHEVSDAPPAPPSPGIGEMALFATFTPFSAGSIINLPVDNQKVMTGTAFSLDRSGEWVVARESIAGCGHPFLNVGGNLGVPFKVRDVAGAANYVIAMTEGGGRGLSMADPANVKPGVRGFMPGFPGGDPGEATTRLIGQKLMEKKTRDGHNEEVLAWALAGRTQGLKTGLSQMTGGPVLDDNSRVMGIILRENPRRGRIYTSLPAVPAALASGSHARPDFDAEAVITKRNYGIVSDSLRREYRVAQVGCIKS